MQKIVRLGPNPALAEILAETGELDRILSGQGLSFERVSWTEPPVAPQPFRIPEPDWEQERFERERRRSETDSS